LLTKCKAGQESEISRNEQHRRPEEDGTDVRKETINLATYKTKWKQTSSYKLTNSAEG